jgi:hypothetical protein
MWPSATLGTEKKKRWRPGYPKWVPNKLVSGTLQNGVPDTRLLDVNSTPKVAPIGHIESTVDKYKMRKKGGSASRSKMPRG